MKKTITTEQKKQLDILDTRCNLIRLIGVGHFTDRSKLSNYNGFEFNYLNGKDERIRLYINFREETTLISVKLLKKHKRPALENEAFDSMENGIKIVQQRIAKSYIEVYREILEKVYEIEIHWDLTKEVKKKSKDKVAKLKDDQLGTRAIESGNND